jgi:limonene-1,2-epoxide hydrolase
VRIKGNYLKGLRINFHVLWQTERSDIFINLTTVINQVMEQKENNNEVILDIDKIKELWTKTYNTKGKPDWSHILPYYDDNIYFRDTIQEIRGIEDFKAMTERLANRSKDLKMNIIRAVRQDNIVFIEWEMTISFKRNPSSVLYGSSRLSLSSDGKITEQRDYYDLWGDIFDNIPRFGKAYRIFLKRKFG